MFLKICFLLPVFITSYINIVPVSVASKVFDEDPYNFKKAKIISSLPEEEIFVYALDWKEEEKEQRGEYSRIVLTTKKGIKFFPCLRVDSNPSFKPEIILSDVNSDGKKELILITSYDVGTGSLSQDVHVYRFDSEGNLIDIYVMDPFEEIYQNIKANMIKKNGVVNIAINVKGKDYTMTAKESSLGYWGNEVYFGAVQSYKVADNKLIAKMSIAVGNAVSFADIVMDYVFENKRLRVNNVTLQKYDLSWTKWAN
jgi:hypothetical protein